MSDLQIGQVVDITITDAKILNIYPAQRRDIGGALLEDRLMLVVDYTDLTDRSIAVDINADRVTVTATGTPEHWPPLPGDVWHLFPMPFEDGSCAHWQAWHAIACTDYAREILGVVEVQMTMPSLPDCDWQSAEVLLARGEMRLAYREGSER